MAFPADNHEMGRRTEPITFLRREADVYGHTIWHLVHMTWVTGVN